MVTQRVPRQGDRRSRQAVPAPWPKARTLVSKGLMHRPRRAHCLSARRHRAWKHYMGETSTAALPGARTLYARCPRWTLLSGALTKLRNRCPCCSFLCSMCRSFLAAKQTMGGCKDPPSGRSMTFESDGVKSSIPTHPFGSIAILRSRDSQSRRTAGHIANLGRDVASCISMQGRGPWRACRSQS